MSQNDFSKSIGYSRGYIADIEKGRTKPSRNLLEKIQEKYNISIDWLLFNEGDPYKHTPEANFKDLREILRLTYQGENKEKIFALLERESFCSLEKTIFLYTIATFLEISTSNDDYLKLLGRFVAFMNKSNVGISCEESRKLILDNALDDEGLLKLALHGFEDNIPGLVFFFTQIFNFLESWDLDPKTMQLRIKLFNEEGIEYDPLSFGSIVSTKKQPHAESQGNPWNKKKKDKREK